MERFRNRFRLFSNADRATALDQYYSFSPSQMALSFKGHVVVVTGAGGGLGRASVSPSFGIA